MFSFVRGVGIRKVHRRLAPYPAYTVDENLPARCDIVYGLWLTHRRKQVTDDIRILPSVEGIAREEKLLILTLIKQREDLFLLFVELC